MTSPRRGIRLPGWPPPPAQVSPQAQAAVPPKAEPSTESDASAPPLVLEQEGCRVHQVTLWGEELLVFHKENPGRRVVMIVYDKKHPACYRCTVVG